MDSDNRSEFLSDEPISSESEDRFGHIEYVDSLEKMIQSSEPPWHIGIFGEWGSGKTSIIRLLFNRICKKPEFKNTIAVEFDAWSHAEGSIRTELLLELDQKIGESVNPDRGEILGEDEITGRLYDVQEEEHIQPPESYQERLTEFWNQNPILTSAFAIIGIIAAVLYLAGFPTLASVATMSLLLPIFGYIIKQLDNVTKTIQRTYLHPRKEWSGAYQRIFESIIDRSNAEKIVISIDNLDRCESETVYDVLVSLKTFMENDKCIYLIPCDDQALVNHISTIEEENEREFLRKFFQAQIRIPPKLVEDIEEYAASENQRLVNPLSDEAIDVITNAYIDNPRRIKHAINRVATLRLLANEIEDTDSVGEGRITGEEAFLAKISILEEEFHEFFDHISEDPGLLNDITDYYNNELESEEREQRVRNALAAGDSDIESRLEAFLRSTRWITVDDPQRFLYLAEPSYATSVENVDEFLDSLKTGREDEVREELKTLEERDGAFDPYLDAVENNLEKYHQSRREQPLYGIIDTSIGIFDMLDEASQNRLAAIIGNYLTTDIGRNFLTQLDVDATFQVITSMDDPNRRDLLNEYTGLVCDNEKLDRPILEAFVAHADEIPATTVRRLSNSLDDLVDSEWEHAFDILDTSQASREHLVTRQVLENAVSLAEVDEGTHEFTKTDYYKRFDDKAQPRVRSDFIETLLELREQYNSGQADQINQSLANELMEIIPDISASTGQQLLTTLRELEQETNQEPLHLVETAFHFFDSFNSETTEEFHDWMADILQRWNPPNIKSVFELSAEHEVPILETDAEVTNILNRIPNNITDQSLIVDQIAPAIPQEFEDQFGDTVQGLISNNDFNTAEIGITIFNQHPEKFQDMIGEVVDTCGNQARQTNNDNQKRTYLQVGANVFSQLDGAEQENYIGHLESLLSGNANHYQLYQELWEQIEDEADQDRREAVAGDVREELVQQISNEQNPEHLDPLISVLQSLTEHIGHQNSQRLMERLSDRLTDNLNENQQATVIDQLAGFEEFYGKESQILDRVENVLGKTNNNQVRESAETLFERLRERGTVEEKRIQDVEASNLSSE